MAYTLMHKNPQYQGAVDIVIYYDTTEKRFLVTSTDKGVGCYPVNREDLVGNSFKYFDQIIDEILCGLPEDLDHLVLCTNLACNAIALLNTENRLKF